MSTVVIADLRGKDGFVNKDTVAGGYGSRVKGDSVVTRLNKNLRRVFQNIPSIHVGYLAAIFANAGHDVVITRNDNRVKGDLALVLSSLVDFRHECRWAESARASGMRVGFFGTAATHMAPANLFGNMKATLAMDGPAPVEITGTAHCPGRYQDHFTFPESSEQDRQIAISWQPTDSPALIGCGNNSEVDDEADKVLHLA